MNRNLKILMTVCLFALTPVSSPAWANSSLVMTTGPYTEEVDGVPFSFGDVNLLHRASSPSKKNCVTNDFSGNGSVCTVGKIELPRFETLEIYSASKGAQNGNDLITTLYNHRGEQSCTFTFVALPEPDNEWSIEISGEASHRCRATPNKGSMVPILYRLDTRPPQYFTEGISSWGSNTNAAAHFMGDSLQSAKSGEIDSAFTSFADDYNAYMHYIYDTAIGAELMDKDVWIYRIRADNAFVKLHPALTEMPGWSDTTVKFSDTDKSVSELASSAFWIGEHVTRFQVNKFQMIDGQKFHLGLNGPVPVTGRAPFDSYKTYFTSPATNSDKLASMGTFDLPYYFEYNGTTAEARSEASTPAPVLISLVPGTPLRFCPSLLNLASGPLVLTPCLNSDLALKVYPVNFQK